MMRSGWMLVLMFSASVEAKLSTAGTSSGDNTYLQDDFPYALVRVVTPHSPLLLTSEVGKQRELLQPVSKDDNKISASERYLTASAAASSESVSPPPRWKDMNKIFLKAVEVQNTKNVSILLAAEASLGRVLGGVERQQLSQCLLVLAYDGDCRQQIVLRDLLLQHNPRQVVHIKTTEDVQKMMSGSTYCRGYLFLLGDPEADPTHTSDWHASQCHPGSGRRRRRSPSTTVAGGTYCDNCSLAHSLASRNADQDSTLVDLVSYLISLTSGRQFYLVYDDVTPGVEDVVRLLQEVFGDTALLPYDPNILLLTEALKSNYHIQAMRNVFILCSATHVANLFEQVRNKVLESPTIQWFVITDEDMMENLTVVLREGTQVALVQRPTARKAQLLSSRVDPDGQIRFHQVGWWSVSGAWYISSQQVPGGLVPDLQQIYSDFRGRQLVVTTNDNWPFFKVKTLENGTVIPISGIDLSVINTVSDKLNFTYRLITAPDGRYGAPQPDDTITGLVGQVARHEAHATLCELFITVGRESVVDFTVPYYLGSATLVSPAPKKKNRSFAIFSTFTVEVWLCICSMTVLVGPFLYEVTRLLVVHMGEEDSAYYSLQSFSFNMYRNLMVQGNLISSSRWSLRFAFFSWYLFCFYIYALYSGTLTAVLAITVFEQPIDSLHEFHDAHRQGYAFGAIRDSSYAEVLQSAKSGIYREVWQLFDHEDEDESLLPSSDVGIEKVLRQKYVFINCQLNSRLQAARWGRHKFYIGRQTFLPQGCGIACSSGSPFKDAFSRVLTRLTEVGLVTKWTNDEINKVSKYTTPTSDSGLSAISLQHLQGAFFVMMVSFALSSVVFLMEIMASRRCQDSKTTYIAEVVTPVQDPPSESGQTTAPPRFSKKPPNSKTL